MVLFWFLLYFQVKGQHHDFLVEDKARADERKEIIDVVQDMIEQHDKLFEVPATTVLNFTGWVFESFILHPNPLRFVIAYD